jgi:hypothetical protein
LPIVSYTVRWAAVNPFSSDARDFTIPLTGGVAVNPDSTLVFAASTADVEVGKKASKSQLVDKISFSLNTSNKVLQPFRIA